LQRHFLIALQKKVFAVVGLKKNYTIALMRMVFAKIILLIFYLQQNNFIFRAINRAKLRSC
jgi:hypothetical protein